MDLNLLPLLNKSEQKLNNSIALLESSTKNIRTEGRNLRRRYKERKLTGRYDLKFRCLW